MDYEKVNLNQTLVVNNGETALISSAACGETCAYAVIDGRKFCNTYKSSNQKAVADACKHAGFPTKFKYANTDSDGCAYIISAYETSSLGICVKELNDSDGPSAFKLSRVFISDFKPKEYKYKMEF